MSINTLRGRILLTVALLLTVAHGSGHACDRIDCRSDDDGPLLIRVVIADDEAYLMKLACPIADGCLHEDDLSGAIYALVDGEERIFLACADPEGCRSIDDLGEDVKIACIANVDCYSAEDALLKEKLMLACHSYNDCRSLLEEDQAYAMVVSDALLLEEVKVACNSVDDCRSADEDLDIFLVKLDEERTKLKAIAVAKLDTGKSTESMDTGTSTYTRSRPVSVESISIRGGEDRRGASRMRVPASGASNSVALSRRSEGPSGSMRDALAHIDQVTEEKKSAQAREFNEKGVFNLLQAQPEVALGYFSNAAQLDPNNPKYFVNKGVTCRLLGDEDGMVDAYGAAIAVGCQDPAILNTVAWAYITQPERGLLDIGMLYAQDAVEKAWHPAFIDTLACGHAARGHFKVAALLEREALALTQDEGCKEHFTRMLAQFQEER